MGKRSEQALHQRCTNGNQSYRKCFTPHVIRKLKIKAKYHWSGTLATTNAGEDVEQ